MNLESVAEKLELDGVGVRGKTVFINHMPSESASGVLLRAPYIGTKVDYELPNYRVTKFNVATRAKDYAQARQLMLDVMASLTLEEVELTGMSVRFIRPRTEPIPFPQSPAGQFEFLVIFDAVYVIVE